ncbi:TPA: transcriptional regulator [Enterobacter asburiae]
MKYIIENAILFDSDSKQISSASSPDVIVPLTTTASRLLEEIVKHPNRVLPRALLLKKVWEDNGYAPSDASLNNNISVLRKYFTSLSDTEVDLRTVPKIGFQLNAFVALHEEQTDITEKNEVQELDRADAVQQTSGRFVSRRRYSVYLLSAGMTVVTLLVIMVFLSLQERGISTLNKKIQGMARFEQCDVFNLSSDGIPFEKVLSQFPSIRASCSSKPANVYYDFSSLNKARAKHLFVSLCFKNDKSGYLKCENIKSYSME